MLIHKDLQGTAGGPEHTSLHGLSDVGIPFMTERGTNSEVQRSGEFVTMRRWGGGHTMFAALFESAEGRDADAKLLDDKQAYAQRAEKDPLGEKYRTRLMSAALSVEAGPQDFETISKKTSRLPRFVQLQEPHEDRDRINAIDYATRDGRKRLFGLGDGYVALVREKFDPEDPRFFMGIDDLGGSHRRTRVSGVEVVKIDPSTGTTAGVLLSFDVFSGLGIDPGYGRQGDPTFRLESMRSDQGLVDAQYVYLPRVGFMWGRRLGLENFSADPSATYSVSEPAVAADDGKSYLSIVAVHGLPQNSPDTRTSILTSLTCTYTKPGGVGTSTVTLPPVPPALQVKGYYFAARAIEVIRTSASNLALRVTLTRQVTNAPDGGTSVQAGSEVAFFWSPDNGRSWGYIDQTPLLDRGTTGGTDTIVPRDDGSALVFRQFNYWAPPEVPVSERYAIAVYSLDATGMRRIGTVPSGVFNAGLYDDTAPALPPYRTFGYGGGVRDGKKQVLWVQVDPEFIFKESGRGSSPASLVYPSTRTMLLVSEDGGVSWMRRMFPQPWPHRIGFVFAVDARTLMVPVYDKRTLTDEGYIKPLRVQLYKSTDAGATWKRTDWKMTLPTAAYVDGWIAEIPTEYPLNLNDSNRGELAPVVAVRDESGEVLPMNPGRPWLADHRRKAP